MRLAIISSPRSGNSWLRKILANTLNVPELACHNWSEMDGAIPKNLILQIHWYREPGFQKFLKDNGFQIIVLKRHPLDVFLSVLRFCKNSKMTMRWLEGNCDVGPLSQPDATPVSEVFLSWCLGFGAENLLSVTYQWAHDPAATHLAYESLVANPVLTLKGILRNLGRDDVTISEAVLAEYGPDYWRNLPNKHGWKCGAGHWKLFFAKSTARKIFNHHRKAFEFLGYDVAEASIFTTAKGILKRWQDEA